MATQVRFIQTDAYKEQCDLLMKFDQAESELGTEMHAKYLKIADDLAARYGVDCRPMVQGSGGPCSCERQ